MEADLARRAEKRRQKTAELGGEGRGLSVSLAPCSPSASLALDAAACSERRAPRRAPRWTASTTRTWRRCRPSSRSSSGTSGVCVCACVQGVAPLCWLNAGARRPETQEVHDGSSAQASGCAVFGARAPPLRGPQPCDAEAAGEAGGKAGQGGARASQRQRAPREGATDAHGSTECSASANASPRRPSATCGNGWSARCAWCSTSWPRRRTPRSSRRRMRWSGQVRHARKEARVQRRPPPTGLSAQATGLISPGACLRYRVPRICSSEWVSSITRVRSCAADGRLSCRSPRRLFCGVARAVTDGEKAMQRHVLSFLAPRGACKQR
jgi:hypothetical protein